MGMGIGMGMGMGSWGRRRPPAASPRGAPVVSAGPDALPLGEASSFGCFVVVIFIYLFGLAGVFWALSGVAGASGSPFG